MDNFEFYNPTKIVFGKGVENQVGAETAKYAKKVLIHFGGGSAIKSGLLDRVRASLKSAGVEFVELGGVQPNPRVTLVREGIELAGRKTFPSYSLLAAAALSTPRRLSVSVFPYHTTYGIFTSTPNPGEDAGYRCGAHHSRRGSESSRVRLYQMRKSSSSGGLPTRSCGRALRS